MFIISGVVVKQYLLFFFQAAVSPVHEIISRELATLPSFLFVEEDFAKHHRAFS